MNDQPLPPPKRARMRWVSPAGFVLAAVAIAVIFALVNALGFRPYIVVLIGAAPQGGHADHSAVLAAIVYAVAALAFILLAPVLVIAAAIFTVLLARRRPRKP